ncbi:hypothetical protein BO82DRAFT_341385 [Aspergillus uvarum CBS 121591]|uniref:BZIP domain-containing protein n=1 Tax=Aspergillus uvarum CBS 121591 TaxID=1448315 RepID=A0A319C590_9EURO|nr:hypothetical protein BO82DRAFT_341385 [Aspergillus uvarum CBS 121591]PYH79059.1 hypothetical protein BO82DRAFT_341385 [Aspergillus uvarum CBS 121591]
MTAPAAQLSSSQRIRDNQRRSRARRKEYLQDLEQRLRRFELLGVQATQEVQAAGRKLAIENAHLRSLLRLHGVSDQQVQAYLTDQSTHLNPPTCRPEAFSEARSSARKCLPSTLGSGGESPRSVSSLNNTSSSGKITSTLAPSSPAAHQQRALSDDQPLDRELPATIDDSRYDSSEWSPTSRYQSVGQSTPCETAAGIIKSMRSYYDAQDIRSELGCQSDTNCMVRNMDIFRLLDEV